jgi:hypothetical protein
MTREIEIGDDGTDVQQLQEALESLGYTEAGTADGRFSEATKDALSRFQSDSFVSVDGKFTPESQTALLTATSLAGTQWQFAELFSDAGAQADTAGGTQDDTAGGTAAAGSWGYPADPKENSEGLTSNAGFMAAGTNTVGQAAAWTGLTDDGYRGLTGDSSEVPSEYRSFKTLFFAYVANLERGWTQGVPAGVVRVWTACHQDPAFIADKQKAWQEQWDWEQKLKAIQKNQQYMWKDGSQSTQRERDTHKALKGLQHARDGYGTGHMEQPHGPKVVPGGSPARAPRR